MNRTASSTLMTEGSIWKKIVTFAFPLFLGNLFQQLYNTADSLIVGNFLGGEACRRYFADDHRSDPRTADAGLDGHTGRRPAQFPVIFPDLFYGLAGVRPL